MALGRGVLAAIITTLLFSILASAYDIGPPYSLSLNVSKTKYAPNETIEGFARIFFDKAVSSETSVKISLANITSSTRKLSELLDELQIQYRSDPTKLVTSNPTLSKILLFGEAGSQQISLKLPKSSTVNSIDADIEGQLFNGSYPQSPSINIANDNTTEWLYAGSFTGFPANRTYPSSLDQTTDSPTIITENGVYYCELFNLPSAKDFRISAKYGVYSATSGTGNITAVISSYQNTGSLTINGANRCKLPEPSSATPDWFSCDISLTNQISGDFLVCIQNRNITAQAHNIYKLSTDSSTATAAYTCPNSGSCSSFSNNFYIGIQTGNYSQSFSERQRLSQGETAFSLRQSITNYLASCQSTTNDCAIPLYVQSNSKGKIALSNLLIQYTSNGVTREERNFYDLTSQQGAIYQINSLNLSSSSTTNISVPFNFQAPDKQASYELGFEIVPGPKQTYKFSVNTSLVQTTTSVDTYLANTKAKLESLLADYPLLLKLTELTPTITSALSVIASKQQAVAALRLSNSSNISNSQFESIKNDVKALVAKLPKSIAVKQSVADKVSVSPEDIPSGVLNVGQTAEKVYFYQKTLNINTKATLYELTFFGGPVTKLTFVEKTLSNIQPGSKVYESIPGYILSSGDIAFEPKENLISSGLFEFGSASKFSYIYEGNLLTQTGVLKTFVVPSQLPAEIKSTLATCGDNICSVLKIGNEEINIEDALTCPQDCKPKTQWTWIVIIILLGLGGVIYINFISNKGKAFKSSKEDLFANPKDLQNLHDYISKASEKGVTNDKITEILVAKGWTSDQVKHAFKTLRK